MFTAKQKKNFISFLEAYCKNNNIEMTKDIIRKEKKIVKNLIQIYTTEKEAFRIILHKEYNYYLLAVEYKKIGEYGLICLSLKEFKKLEDNKDVFKKTKDFIKSLIEYFEGE